MALIPEAPVIIIGNAGSGSTLLDRVLNAHPDIAMQGEMKFLVAHAWAAFQHADANTILRDLPAYFANDPGLEARIKTDPAQFTQFLRLLEDKELRRRGAVLRHSIAAWFCLEELRSRFWGFKEIANDGSYDWKCYDCVFPQAHWVHIVRHPLDWLPAGARLSGTTLSSKTIPVLLNTWVANVRSSRQRATTDRYHEIKYEDLRAKPVPALTPLFNSLGLKWHPECELPVFRQWGATSEKPPEPTKKARAFVSATKGLEQLMASYGYSVQDAGTDTEKQRTPRACLERTEAGHWKIVPPILRENGNCWEVDLSNLATADELAAAADDVNHWERSPLRLFENGKALGPPHALHFRIRSDGGGQYSHWQNRLLFSTSDNSSPNDNGRAYSLALEGRTRELQSSCKSFL